MLRALFALALAGFVAPAVAQQTTADIACKPTVEKLVYDCDIRLKDRKSGKPVTGAQVTVGADMPSMPMAHNVRPVKATPGTEPGAYKARLALEMHGEWAVKLRLAGPVRDQIVQTLRFEDEP